MTPSSRYPKTTARGLRRAFLLQSASGLLTIRAHRRSADRTRARPMSFGLSGLAPLGPIRTDRTESGWKA